MIKNVGVFTELKKIKKYVYDSEANLFKPELDEKGQEKDGYELYPDHRHDGYNQNYSGHFSDDYTRIQNNPLTKFLILGDFDKNFQAESMIENWHGMSYESQISSNAQFLCNDENLNLIISEGLRFLEIGWKYDNDNARKHHQCDGSDKEAQDIEISYTNIVALLFYTSEIRRLPYKQGDPIKKHGSPETKVKLTEENAVKLMNEVDKQIQNISALLGKDFNLSSYNELCQKIYETESELTKCQNEWFSVVHNLNNKISYGKDEKGKSIIDKLTDVDKLKEKYSFEYGIPFGQNNKGNVTDYCVWDNISQDNQNKLIEIDKRQQPLKKALDELNVQKQSMLNQISGSHDKNYNQEEKKIEQLTKLMNIKSDIDKMIYSQISGDVKIDDNNPIQVIKNVVPQIDGAEEKEDKNPKITQLNNNVLNNNHGKNLIQNNSELIEQNKADTDVPQTENQIKLNEETKIRNIKAQALIAKMVEIFKSRGKILIHQRLFNQNFLNQNQEENLIQNNNDGIEQNNEMLQNLNELIKQRDELIKQRNEVIKQRIEQNKNIIQLNEDVLANYEEMSQNPDFQNFIESMLQNNNKLIEHNKNIIQLKKQLETFESTEEILNDDNNEAKNKTNSESEKETNEKLEDLSNEPPEQKVSSETKQDDNLDIKKELSTIIDEYQSSIMNKRQEDQQKQKERVNEFQKLQNINDKATYRPTTFVVDKQNDEDKTGEYVNMQQKTNENNKLDNKGKNEESTKNNTTQTDSKNSTDNPIVHFFKWLINTIISWFGYPELWPLNNIKIPDEINSANPEKNQKLQNENPKLEKLSQGPNKQNKDI